MGLKGTSEQASDGEENSDEKRQIVGFCKLIFCVILKDQLKVVTRPTFMKRFKKSFYRILEDLDATHVIPHIKKVENESNKCCLPDM